MSKSPVVSIIDDDALVRDALKDLVRSLGYVPEAFASAEEYLESDYVWTSSCLIADIHMPGMSGVELQDQMIADGNSVPIIFMTAFADEATRMRVLEAGACDFLKKPFDDNSFTLCIENALKARGAA